MLSGVGGMARDRVRVQVALVGREGRKDVVTLSAVRLTPVAAPPIVGQTRGDRPKKSRDRCGIHRPPRHVLRQINIFRHSQPLNRFRGPAFAFCRNPTRIGGDRRHSTLRFSLVSRSCHRHDAVATAEGIVCEVLRGCVARVRTRRGAR